MAATAPKWAQKPVSLPPHPRGCHLVTSKVKMALQYMRRVIQKKAKFDIIDLNCTQVSEELLWELFVRRGLGRFQFTKEPFVEDTEPRKLESIKFSLQSESDILKAGEVDVWRANYYDGLRKPIANGLLDPKMGPANKQGVCATCYAKFDDCPGHFGCLTLALPVFNIGYFGAILEILKCICKSCSHVLLDEKICSEYLKKMRNPKFDSLKKTELKKKLVQKCSGSAKAIKCWRCGYQNGL